MFSDQNLPNFLFKIPRGGVGTKALALFGLVPQLTKFHIMSFSSRERNCTMSSSSYLFSAGRKVKLVIGCGVAWGSPLWDVTWDGWLLRWCVMGLTVVKSERVIQAAQLLQSGMHHSCSVMGNRQCLRFSIMNYGSQPFLVPATWVRWDRSKS